MYTMYGAGLPLAFGYRGSEDNPVGKAIVALPTPRAQVGLSFTSVNTNERIIVL